MPCHCRGYARMGRELKKHTNKSYIISWWRMLARNIIRSSRYYYCCCCCFRLPTDWSLSLLPRSASVFPCSSAPLYHASTLILGHGFPSELTLLCLKERLSIGKEWFMRLLSPRQDILSIFSNNSQLPFCLGLREPGWGAGNAGGARTD